MKCSFPNFARRRDATGQKTLFLSCVTDEFKAHRLLLTKQLTLKQVSVKAQEDFHSGGGKLLETIGDYIATSDAVIHLVGRKAGSCPTESELESIRKRHEVPMLDLTGFGLHEADLKRVSYTQWEAYLALLHKKKLFVYRSSALRTELPERQEAGADQEAHLSRLMGIGHDCTQTFESPDELCIKVLRDLISVISRPRILSLPALLLAGCVGVLIAVLVTWNMASSPWKNWPSMPVLNVLAHGQPASSSSGLADQAMAVQFEIFAQHKGRPEFRRIDSPDRLRSGVDNYVAAARTEVPSFLYVIQIDSSGRSQCLFPQLEGCKLSRGQNPVIPNQIKIFPPEGSQRPFYLDEVTGVEHLYAVFSASRWTELEEVLSAAESGSDQRPDVLIASTSVQVKAPLGITRGIGGQRLVSTDAVLDLSQIQSSKAVLPGNIETAAGSFVVLERSFYHVP